MLKSYFLAKLLKRIRLSSFKDCSIHKTSRVSSGCTLTKVTMGRYSYTGENTRITDTIIGSFCSIGMNCTIGGGLHPLYMVSTSPVFLNGKNIMRKHFSNHDFLSSETVTIGNDVWIGSYAFIMSGLTIGDGAVIGANSVVTHDIEPYSIVAGVPAKQIRKRFDDETIDGLLKTKWWDMQESELEEVAPLFNTPDRFLLRKNKEKELNEDSIC